MPLMALAGNKTSTTGSPWKLRPWRTIFKDKDHGWSPLLWVIYLGFFFIDPILSHASAKLWLLDGLGAVIFLFFYFGLFALECPRALLHIAGMMVLGVLFEPINQGACTFFIFAAAMIPFCVETQLAAVIGLITIGSVGAIEGLLLHINGWTLFYSTLFPVIIGAGNTFFAERNRMNCQLRKANEEIEQLAKVAERERIARDLHDVLGHTLSVITLKAELAGRLMKADPDRAAGEIAEVESLARTALAEVREAIGGYRARGLAAEIESARRALDAAGVTLIAEMPDQKHTSLSA